MTDVTRISVICTAEFALKRLKKADICVYNCKKQGAAFLFSVKDKDIKKVFAIFAKPCYNVSVIRESGKNKLLRTAINRIGLIIGAIAFVAVAALSNLFIFRISVTGSGSYLSPEIRRIVYETGVKEFSLYKDFDAPAATGKILALPQVTFCNIKKSGAILKIDVQIDEEHNGTALKTPLTADKSGVIKKLVVVCGTPAKNVGDKVEAGETLIEAYTFAGDIRTDCLAAGFAEIECAGRAEFFAEAESEENLIAAYASVNLEADKILTRTHTVTPCEGGVTYVIDFTYLHKLSINME